MTDNFIHPKRSLGQKFLTDPHYLRLIVNAAQVGPADQVLEIGPGLGHLTRELAVRAGRLVVIELDDRLIPRLHEVFGPLPHVGIVHADRGAVKRDFGSTAAARSEPATTRLPLPTIGRVPARTNS